MLGEDRPSVWLAVGAERDAEWRRRIGPPPVRIVRRRRSFRVCGQVCCADRVTCSLGCEREYYRRIHARPGEDG